MMLDNVVNFLSKFYNQEFRVSKRCLKGQKSIALTKDYFLCYEKELEYKELLFIKLFILEALKEEENIQKRLKRCNLLEEELKKTLKSTSALIQKRDYKALFEFLSSEVKYVLIENGEVVLNSGIDKFTIKTTVAKLEKSNPLSLPLKGGELFAVKEGFFTIILQSPFFLEDFTKDILRSRLLWLDKLYEAKRLYEIDPLTGLFSRMKFLEDLFLIKPPVFFINLKNFKTINELYGSYIGDKILKELSLELKRGFKTYRILGDKLAVLADNESSIEAVLSKKFLIYNDKTKEYIEYEPKYQLLKFSSIEPEIIEKALNAFKKSSKQFIYFEKDIKPLLKKEEENFYILLEVIEKESVVPFFQRVVTKDRANTVYFEALMRLLYKDEFLSPFPFLKLAKDRGLYTKLNKIMIKKTLQSIDKLKKKVSINIDVYDILQENFVQEIEEFFELFNIDASMVQFEILETEDFYQYIPQVKRFIDIFKKKGCYIALDDFGVGYSNFDILKHLDIDVLKIDISLTKSVATDKKSLKILGFIANFSKSFLLHNTAEGVEDSSIYELLKDMPIDYLQGYLIDKPKPLEKIVDIYS